MIVTVDARSRALVLESIEKSFEPGVPILRGISAAFETGSFVSLLGPSGSGKTTLLRILAGFEAPDRGRILLDGEDISHIPPERRPFNTVFQSYALFPHLSVFDNVAFGLRSRRVQESEVRRRVTEFLERFRSLDLAARLPSGLSGGQKQRVALARALVNEPRVVLLDEPLSALDGTLRSELQRELYERQRASGATFVLVTHDREEAAMLSDHVIVIRDGLIEQQGPPRELHARPRTRFVAEFVGRANVLPASRSGTSIITTALGDLETSEAVPWERGLVSLRPEDLLLRSANERTPEYDRPVGTLLKRFFRGGYDECWIEFDGQRLRAHVSPEAPWTEGDRVHVRATPNALRVLDG